jgi:hypothetical protein
MLLILCLLHCDGIFGRHRDLKGLVSGTREDGGMAEVRFGAKSKARFRSPISQKQLSGTSLVSVV